MMHSVRWLSFGICGTLTKTLVHFFPSAGSVTAPYPAQCKITVFGGDSRRSVILDGARFSHPDGVALTSAFPFLETEKTPLVGFVIELSTSQARLDLNSSSCVVEFASQVTSTRFQPQRFGFDDETGDVPASQGGLGLALTDSRCTTSVVIVNSLSGTVDPLVSTAISTGSEIQTTRIGIPPVAADSVREIELGENKLEGASRIDLGFGPSRASMLVLDGERVDGVSYYVLYRDALTKRPIAVSCL